VADGLTLLPIEPDRSCQTGRKLARSSQGQKTAFQGLAKRRAFGTTPNFFAIYSRTHKKCERSNLFRTDAVDSHQVRCWSICLQHNLGMVKLYGTEAFGFESLGDLSGIVDEMVSGERQLKAQLSLPQV